MATVQEVITQKLTKEFEVGKNFCLHDGYWVGFKQECMQNQCARKKIKVWHCYATICDNYYVYKMYVVKWIKNKPFFQPIHLDVINESFMHNVPKGKVLACISYF